MLKQPDRIVIYPQRDSSPDYLLCWIPPGHYSDVSGGNPEIVSELQEYYPGGIETDFSQDGFDEFGISLTYDLNELRDGFLELSDSGVFAEINFVDIERLQDYVDHKDDQHITELIKKFTKGDITLNELKEDPILRKLLEEPKTKGHEDPGEAFQKLSGQLENSD